MYKLYRKILRKYLFRPNITGISIGFKEIGGKLQEGWIVFKFYVYKKYDRLADSSQIIPRKLYGYDTDVVESHFSIGTLLPIPKTLSECTDKRCQIYDNPVGGVSIGHYKITAGTLSTAIHDELAHKPAFMSNFHVLAYPQDRGIGDLILQPGKYDIDRLNLDYNKSKYGTLYRWVTVKTISSTECPISNIEKSLHNYLASLLNRKTWMMPLVLNTVDVAIGLPEYNDRDITIPIIKIPKLTGVFRDWKNVLGVKVQKSGRTTCHTRGIVSDYPLSLNVNYGELGLAYFTDQLGIRPEEPDEPFIQGGDSGSLLVTEDYKVIGLCFAGNQNGSLGVANTEYNLKKEMGDFGWICYE